MHELRDLLRLLRRLGRLRDGGDVPHRGHDVRRLGLGRRRRARRLPRNCAIFTPKLVKFHPIFTKIY